MGKPIWDAIKSYTLLSGPAFEIWTKYVLRGKAFWVMKRIRRIEVP